MSFPFRTALVTGASSGIGEVMAHRLGAAGVATVLVARRADRLEAVAAAHPGSEVLVADLATRSGQDAVADRIGDGDRPIDLVVNNAGFGTNGTFHELDVERVTEEVELNITALTRLSHAALRAMVPRGTGWLLNVSSVAGFQSAPNLAVYAATKAYVTSFTESLHAEARPHGVHVTALCPGLTKTEFQRVSNTETYADSFPGFVWTSVDQVAAAGLDAVVKGRTVAVPGVLYKGLVAASGVTPRAVTRRISSVVQRR